jgi:Fic family protein
MLDAMSDLEKYMNAEDGLDELIRAGLIHYQFETIHPFLDGNGRVGRMLITLFLMERKILTTPTLYISYFLKKNRIEYYDRMTEVRRTGNYEQWVKFFLLAIYESAEDATHTIDKLITHYG